MVAEQHGSWVLVEVEQQGAVAAALQPARIGGRPARRVALAEQIAPVGTMAIPGGRAALGEVAAVLATGLAVAAVDLRLCARIENGRAAPPLRTRALEDTRIQGVLGEVGAAVPRLLGLDARFELGAIGDVRGRDAALAVCPR